MSRRRLLVLIITLLFIVSVLPVNVFADDVCFISINDTLLELTSTPVFSGSTVYVPSRVFDSFHIYYNFFSSDNTAMVYTGTKQYYFDLSNGNTYDSSNNYYSTQAILRNGEVYLPAKFICGQFGLSYSFITGTGHGDIFRITDGRAVLSDASFFSAASMLMEKHYNSYMGISSPSDTDTAPDEEDSDRHETDVMLSFIGLPSEMLLSSLNTSAARAGFFLSPAEIESAPDTVRRLICEGHTVGVCCGDNPAADYDAASTLLFDAAHIVPLMIAAGSEDCLPECDAYAVSAGLALLQPDAEITEDTSNAMSITSLIELSDKQITVLSRDMNTAERLLPVILHYLKQNQFSIRAPRETDAL